MTKKSEKLYRTPTMFSSGKHGCPRRGCEIIVSNDLFCCHKDWFDLPSHVRLAITSTQRLSLLSEPRRKAIAAARTAWDELDARNLP